MKRRNILWTLMMTLLLMFCFSASALAASATAHFGTEVNGKWKETYPKKAITVKAGAAICLPDMKSSTCVYAWGVRRNGKVTYYDVKAKVRLNQNTSFFLKSFPACTLEFYTTNGKIEFPQYRMRVRKGAVVKLPDVFYFGGFLLTGWSTKFGVTAPMYQPGQKYTVQKSVKLYRTSRLPENASQEKNGKIIYLMHKDGSFFKAIRRTANCTFPDYRPSDGSTMLGWGRKQGQSAGVLCSHGEVIPKDSSLYYMVLSTAKDDAKYNTSISKPAKYGKVFFIGNSRMSHTIKHFGSNKPSWLELIAGSGKGYRWLAGLNPSLDGEGAYTKLLRNVKSYHKTSKGKRIAVIFNLGINDTFNLNNYVKYYKKIGPVLKSYNCDLFFMSVNPCDNEMTAYYCKNILHAPFPGVDRSAHALKHFNRTMRRELAGMYTYIDCYHYLQKNGWYSANVNVRNYPDGVHYSKNTSLRIIQYALKSIR